MQMNPRFWQCAIFALFLSLSFPLVAQGHGHDRDDHGQGRDDRGYDDRDHDRGNRDHDRIPPGQAKHMDEGRGLPPGQAKKYFHDADRDRFYANYRVDVDHWRGRHRPVFVVGQTIAPVYVVRPVPPTIWVNVVAPPPPGYQYGYYGGYVVAYNPATRIVADVLDLVDAVHSR